MTVDLLLRYPHIGEVWVYSSLSCKSNSFSFEWFRTRTRFEKEPKLGNGLLKSSKKLLYQLTLLFWMVWHNVYSWTTNKNRLVHIVDNLIFFQEFIVYGQQNGFTNKSVDGKFKLSSLHEKLDLHNWLRANVMQILKSAIITFASHLHHLILKFASHLLGANCGNWIETLFRRQLSVGWTGILDV